MKKSDKKQQAPISLWAFAVFFATLCLAAPWFDIYVSNYDVIKAYTAGIGGGVLFLLVLWHNRTKTIIEWQLNPLKIGLLALFGLATASVFWAINLDFFVAKWLLLVSVVFSFVAASTIKITHQNLIKFSWILLMGGAIISGIGVLQFLFDPFSLAQAVMPASTFGNKNVAVQPLVLIAPLALFLLFSNQVNGVKVWVLSVIMVLMLVFIFYTTTRSVWVSIAVEALLIGGYMLIRRANIKQWIDWNKNKRNACLFALLAILVLSNFSATGWKPLFSTVNKTIKETQTEVANPRSSRYRIWGVAADIIKDAPVFGSGLGSWYQNISAQGYGAVATSTFQRAHNDLIELTAELGLVGILIFIAIAIALISSVIKIIKHSADDIGWFYLLLLAALTGSFVNMQFSFPYQTAVPLVLFGWFSAVISTQMNAVTTPIKTVRFSVSSWHKNTILALWTAFWLLLTTIYISWAGVFSGLNQMHLKGKQRQLADILQTPIYHPNTQSILHSLSDYYFINKEYKKSLQVDKQVLNYWDNDTHALYHQGFAQIQTKQYGKALKSAIKLQEVAEGGNYKGNMLEFLVYKKTKQSNKARQALEAIIQQPMELLVLDKNTYYQLLVYASGIKELNKYAQKLYQQYRKHFGYRCNAESAIAVFYYRQKEFERAAAHAQRTMPRCKGGALIDIFRSKKLLN